MRQTVFKGTAPILDPMNLGEQYAQTAINCRMDSGSLEPWRTPLEVATPTKGGAVRTLYRFGQDVNGDAQYWFNLLADGHFARGPVDDDANERTYFTQAGQPPRVTDITLATGADLPSNWRALGVPQPKGTLTASVSNRGITSITRSGKTATATVGLDLEYAAGSTFEAVISGAGQAEYNGSFSNATVTGARTFTFEVNGTPATPATGTPSFHYGGSAETRLYTYTWRNDLNNEGAPWLTSQDSPLSVVAMPGQIVTLSGFETSPAFTDRLDSVIPKDKRLYRSNGGSFVMEAEIPTGTTSYVSAVTELSGQITLEAPYYLPPPADMQGLIALDNETMAGFRKQSVMFSVRSMPHAWPTDYWMDVPYPAVGLGRIAGGLIACTTAKAVLIAVGSDPASASPQTYENTFGCVSARSIVSADGGVFYASPDGLALASASGVLNVTDKLMSREQWQALKPETILGAYHDKRYFGFYDTGAVKGGFILRVDTGELTWTDAWASAAHSDPRNDALYLVIDGKIRKWNGGAGYMNMKWKSRKWAKVPGGLAAAKVEASGAVTFRHYRNGVLKQTKAVTTDKHFNLSPGRCSRDEFELEGAAKVTLFATSDDRKELF